MPRHLPSRARPLDNGTAVQPRPNTWFDRASSIGFVGFGVFIAATSAIGIALGVHAGEGWLAILYGGLGVSMGVAGIAGVWMTGAPRGALFGWFLVGLASRAIVEGSVNLLLVSLPIAAALLSALTFELLHRPSIAGTVGAAAGGCLAVLALAVLAIVAPSLPVICAPFPAPGKAESFILYPGNTPPFDVAERSYDSRCLGQVPPTP